MEKDVNFVQGIFFIVKLKWQVLKLKFFENPCFCLMFR